jgi:hypothetical protein
MTIDPIADLRPWYEQALPYLPPITERVGSTAPIWAPTVDNMAKVLPAYTAGGFDDDAENAGALQGEFTDTTEPTATEVDELILTCSQDVEGRIGLPIQEKDYNLARAATIWLVAATVSAGKQPANTDDATGEYRGYVNNFTAAMNALTTLGRMPLNSRMR